MNSNETVVKRFIHSFIHSKITYMTKLYKEKKWKKEEKRKQNNDNNNNKNHNNNITEEEKEDFSTVHQ